MNKSIDIFIEVLERYYSQIKLEDFDVSDAILFSVLDGNFDFIDSKIELELSVKNDFLMSLCSELADVYTGGIPDSVLIKLVEDVKHEGINNAIKENEKLTQAFRNKERGELKALFSDLDEKIDIENDKYLEQALRNIGRRELKGYLNSLEEEAYDRAEASQYQAVSSSRKNNDTSKRGLFISIAKYAAVIILLIIPAYLFIQNLSSNEPTRIANNDKINRSKQDVSESADSTNKDELNIPEPDGSDPAELTNKDETRYGIKVPEQKVVSFEKKILSDANYGYANTEVKIKINIVNLRTQLAFLEGELVTETPRRYGKPGSGPNLKLIQKKIDSIQSIDQSYKLVESVDQSRSPSQANLELTLYTINQVEKNEINILNLACVLSLANLDDFDLIMKLKETLYGLKIEVDGKLQQIDGEIQDECITLDK